jgi:ATP-binding cassette, subfamily C, bacterial LapB
MVHFSASAEGGGLYSSPALAARPVQLGMDKPRAARSLPSLLASAMHLPPSVIIASLTINMLGLALPLVVLQIFDRVIRYQALNTLTLLIGGLFCVVLAESILRFTRNWLVGEVALLEGFKLHMQGATRILGASRSAAAKLSPESASDAMAAIDEMSQFLSSNGRLALLDFPFVVLFLGLIWAIAGAIVIIPIVLIIAFTLWTVRSSANFKRLLNEQVELERDRFDFYSECLRGISTVKALAIEPQMQRRLEILLQAGAPVNFMLVLRTNRMITAGQLFASLTIVSIVSVGGLMSINGIITIGSVAACLLIANRVTQPVLRIIGVWGQLESARLASERFAPLMALEREAPLRSEATGPAGLELINVAMTGESGGDGPRGIFLYVRPGDVIGITIPDFNQRAQFLEILRGERRPDRGGVSIDSIDISRPVGEIRAPTPFFVGSRPDIFHGTILDNISMFRRISHAAALETARSLGIEPVIHALPQGYDTRLGDIGAAALPYDILQAICIARATAIRPRILVTDIRRVPPDDISTRACTKAIKALRGVTTVIIIGRHLSEVKDADRIFSLEDWRLLEIPRPLAVGEASGPLALPAPPQAAQGGMKWE